MTVRIIKSPNGGEAREPSSAYTPPPSVSRSATGSATRSAGAAEPSAGTNMAPERSWFWKRPLDTGLILLTLPVTIPIGLVVAVVIKLVSPGPIFFSQTRIGLHGKSFRCLKFRTLVPNADEKLHRRHFERLASSTAPMSKMDQFDTRIIPLGRVLRASGLDEVPQFLNVLRGEMSLIGPRPCTPYEFERYLPWQRERFAASPGITGLWQVSGKNRTTFHEMICWDI